jgi:hypothetical protein
VEIMHVILTPVESFLLRRHPIALMERGFTSVGGNPPASRCAHPVIMQPSTADAHDLSAIVREPNHRDAGIRFSRKSRKKREPGEPHESVCWP